MHYKSCKLGLKGLWEIVLPCISQSFSPVPLLRPAEILCLTGEGWLCDSEHFDGPCGSDPFSAQEQDQHIPKPSTTDVCLSCPSKTNKKWWRYNSLPSQSISCLIILTVRFYFHVYPKSLLWPSKPIISHPVISEHEEQKYSFIFADYFDIFKGWSCLPFGVDFSTLNNVISFSFSS